MPVEFLIIDHEKHLSPNLFKRPKPMVSRKSARTLERVISDDGYLDHDGGRFLVIVLSCWTKDVIRRYGWCSEKLTGSGISAVAPCVNPSLGGATSCKLPRDILGTSNEW